jgi:UDP-N-acetylmuramoyl-L-alanyl-D-glutamate--2,6-diaminopimelate ligase
MQLSELIEPLEKEVYNMVDVDIKSLEFDSRKVRSGTLFIALRGERADGHDFVEEAVRRGAVAVLTEKKLSLDVPIIVVDNTRTSMGKLARMFYDDHDQMTKIGITGTNGKTTTAFLTYSILKKVGAYPCMIGTIYYVGKECTKAVRTTPESLDIFRMLNKYREEGVHTAVMEVSSHALSLNRVDELRFDVAVFTNLSQDHLDFHHTIAAYRDAKLRLFSLLTDQGTAVYNLDDPMSEKISILSPPSTLTFSMNHDGDLQGEVISDTLDGLEIDVLFKDECHRIRSALIGRFNAYNILAACGVGCALNIDFDLITQGIGDLKSIRGRMERVLPNVFIDYAHTPSAVENALRSLRQYAAGRLVIVFGCGGDRDKEKRPLMGEIATRMADRVILTSDNPRGERACDIIQDIERGIEKSNYDVIEDRKEAICCALREKQDKDVILVAGKGHEDYQIIGDRTIHFDDAEVIRSCIKNS